MNLPKYGVILDHGDRSDLDQVFGMRVAAFEAREAIDDAGIAT